MRPPILITANEYLGFKREFPNTDMKKAMNLINITGFYFSLSVVLMILLPWIKDHPDYFYGKHILEKINKFIQKELIKLDYIERILASAWWFIFLIIPIIYFNDRRKQKK